METSTLGSGMTGGTGGAPPGNELMAQIRGGKNLEARLRTLMFGWLKGLHAANNTGTPNAEVTAWEVAERGLIDGYIECAIEGPLSVNTTTGGG